jgi:hypothetical protein
MAESQKANRLVWILSLTLGPVVYCAPLLTLPGMLNIEAIKKNIIDILVSIAFCWVIGFVFVWVWYWLGKFVIKYGPFI